MKSRFHAVQIELQTDLEKYKHNVHTEINSTTNIKYYAPIDTSRLVDEIFNTLTQRLYKMFNQLETMDSSPKETEKKLKK